MSFEEREKKIEILKSRLNHYIVARDLSREDYETDKNMGYEKYKKDVIGNDSNYTKEEFNAMLLNMCSSILDLDRLINQVRLELLKLGEMIF